MVRDVQIRNRSEYDQFFDHLLTESMTGWMFTQSYNVLNLVNTAVASDIEGMEGSENQKKAIRADLYFLRALVNFDLNNYFALPSTGYSIPLVTSPIGVNDRVSSTSTIEVIQSIEQDIEEARTLFQEIMDASNIEQVSDYYAATALAARIYFYHKKYDLAYERANEVIDSDQYIIEGDVAAPFVPGSNSRENIFKILYNPADGQGSSPTDRIAEAYQASATNGFYIVNPDGEAAQLVSADTSDLRYKAFYLEADNVTYVPGKYSTDQMDFIYIRLSEMYLTRAEANIMVNNSVSQQDIDDINVLRSRANATTVLPSIPSVSEALQILYEDRIKELAFESGDHYMNVRRLERGIVRIPVEGTGMKPYSEYADLLVFPFPENEIKIHGLTRTP
jgi:hypothetical protein